MKRKKKKKKIVKKISVTFNTFNMTFWMLKRIIQTQLTHQNFWMLNLITCLRVSID